MMNYLATGLGWDAWCKSNSFQIQYEFSIWMAPANSESQPCSTDLYAVLWDGISIWNALCDLVHPVQYKKRKTPMEEYYF